MDSPHNIYVLATSKKPMSQDLNLPIAAIANLGHSGLAGVIGLVH